ncbi:MAG: hypothetical protein HQL34_14255, partial [Alphaproteobacteria bacterium]|nr:hypothetical protein [Alphaproteobacteria bacterium]
MIIDVRHRISIFRRVVEATISAALWAYILSQIFIFVVSHTLRAPPPGPSHGHYIFFYILSSPTCLAALLVSILCVVLLLYMSAPPKPLPQGGAASLPSDFFGFDLPA